MIKASWENIVNLVIGAWAVAAPWLYRGGELSNASSLINWSFWLVGAVLALAAGLALWDLRPWEEWTNLTLGFWLILSPWVLSFTNEIELKSFAVMAGVVVAALAGIALPSAQKLMQEKKITH